MKNLRLFLLLAIPLFSITLQAQDEVSIEELKEQKAEIQSEINEKTAEVNTLKSSASALQKQIDILGGWQFGFGGTVGFAFNNNKRWAASPNPDAKSSSLGLNLSGYANNIKEKSMWRNSGILTKQWQDIDLDDSEDDGLFDNGTVDLLNLSSLYGYRFSPKFAASAMGELNTSLGNFLSPGTADLGAGATWTPNNNLVVIVHPLNYHFSFSGFDNVENQAALGAKLRAEYNKKFTIVGNEMLFTSTFTSFLPYGDQTIEAMTPEGEVFDASMSEFSWINNIAFNLWKGIGVGVGWGLRKAEFENQDMQSFFSLGLNYAF
ncbi:DUF3078 domain-containing protein [Membranihabitans maritimus]|uniref:DUF3078 domain-containing protein n=1 Tax=Membranihabitans maritimus TaxID=2904244 RepID=UPI001F4513FE|nr:cell division protein ZapB [Membranihabitans maritimus]